MVDALGRLEFHRAFYRGDRVLHATRSHVEQTKTKNVVGVARAETPGTD
jgi:hypothetical protein